LPHPRKPESAWFLSKNNGTKSDWDGSTFVIDTIYETLQGTPYPVPPVSEVHWASIHVTEAVLPLNEMENNIIKDD
jgi:hypothetical protein